MKLIIINGPCGVGKSTFAKKLHKDMPLSFLLDIDAQSRFISGYKENPAERWELTSFISQSIIDACLSAERDVIVDKIIYDADLLDSYHVIAKHHGAEVVELILWADKETTLKRAEGRGWQEDKHLTRESCAWFWDEIEKVKEARRGAIIIETDGLSEKEVEEKIMDEIN